MTQEIQKAVESGKLTKPQGAALEKLQPGTYAVHKSWGFGQVEAIDFLMSQMTIHFKAKRSHAMQLSYAADSLQPIPPEHILAQKAGDLPAVRKQAKEEPVRFMASVLQSYGGKITQDQLATVMAPDIFPEGEFKRWWDSAKKLLKKDGHYAIPSKKTEPIVLRSAPVARSDEHLAAFAEARQLKDQISALDQITKDLEEFADPVLQLGPIVRSVEEAARRNQRLHTNEALQLILARDEIVERSGGKLSAAETPSLSQVLREEERQLRTLLAEVPAAKLKRVLAELPKAYPDAWAAKTLDFVLYGHTRIVSDSARLLQDQQKAELLRTGLDHAIRDHSISSAALTWLCDKRERKGEFAELIHPRVLSSMLSALERDQFLESRDRKLHDLLVNDKELITDLIADASDEEMREVMRRLMLSPVFEELNKRALLGRIVRLHPELQGLITGAVTEKQEALIVSWESLERRKEEYEDLVNKKIPQNVQEIATAREHGDLRENFEFKAAKEMQRVLDRRRAETERELTMARGTDFANADTSMVSIGTVVTLRGVDDGKVETYQILGAWDGDPERGIISYQTAIAQALLGTKARAHVQLPTETGEREVVVEAIVAWQKPAEIVAAG